METINSSSNNNTNTKPTPTSSTPPTTKTTLPRGVLTGYVFPFLGPKSLLRCALVCKEWKEAADEDHLWRTLCGRKWIGKFYVPKVNENTLEPETLFVEAKYGKNTHLTIKDIKEILKLRNVDITNKLEKKELIDALITSQGTSFGTWSYEMQSKWKTSYVYAAHSIFETSISLKELINTEWKMEFKYTGAPDQIISCKFHPDGRYSSSLSLNGSDMFWKFVDDQHIREKYQPVELQHKYLPPGRHACVQIAEYPPLWVARRSDDYSIELHNNWVRFYNAVLDDKHNNKNNS
jgi:hypothetical protein